MDVRFVKHAGDEQPELSVFTSDEDADLRGIIVIEKCGKEIIEEAYAVYEHGFQPPLFACLLTAAKVRTQKQKKDEELWHMYETTEVKENGDFLPTPPVWVSAPADNDVEVWVQLFDRKGHKSNRMKLLYIDRSLQ